MSKTVAHLILACFAAVLGFGAYSCYSLSQAMRGEDYEGSVTETVDSLVQAFEDDEVAATARLRKQLIIVGGKMTRKEVSGSRAQVNIAGSCPDCNVSGKYWGYVELRDVSMGEAASLQEGNETLAECRLGNSYRNSVGSRVVSLKNCKNVRSR